MSFRRVFRRFSLCTPVLFSGIRKFLPSRRFQILYRGKTKVDIKIRFFTKRKRKFQLVLSNFWKDSNLYIIDIDPSFQFVVRDGVRVDFCLTIEPRRRRM